MPSVLIFTLLGTEYLCILINVLEFGSEMQLNYLMMASAVLATLDPRQNCLSDLPTWAKEQNPNLSYFEPV